MHNLLLFDHNETPISVEALDEVFRTAAGFGRVRYNTPIGTPIEAEYAYGDDFTTVRLHSDRETISISGTSDAALRAAWAIQTQLPSRLRIVDTDYSFDLIVADFKNLEDLRSAIDRARAS
ncbi:MAG: hypothetical protein AB7O59_13890 [Pirellulales bacterium]